MNAGFFRAWNWGPTIKGENDRKKTFSVDRTAGEGRKGEQGINQLAKGRL